MPMHAAAPTNFSVALKTLLLAIALAAMAGGCSRSPESRLLGAWEGKAKPGTAVAVEETDFRSCRFDFDDSGAVQITLRLADRPEQVAEAQWRVYEVGLDELKVQLSLPAEGEAPARTSRLNFDFSNGERVIVTELDGDYRMPSLVLTRPEAPAS